MEPTIQPYNERKMKLLRDYLLRSSAEGRPRYYEIRIDDFRAVPRTNNASLFDGYLESLESTNKLLEVFIYNTHPRSFNAEKHRFRVSEPEKAIDSSLSGMDVDAKIQSALDRERERVEHEKLCDELDKAKDDLTVAQKKIKEQEEELVKFRGKKMQWGNVHLGEFASVVLEGIVRRNPQMIAKIPGGEALAGFIIEDNKARENGTFKEVEEAEVTFSKAEENPKQEFSKEQERFLKVLEMIEENFAQGELVLINSILERLIEKPEDLKTIASLLGIL
jgi:hypothetical protein